MLFRQLTTSLFAIAAFAGTFANSVQTEHKFIVRQDSELLQDIVTWDEHSIFVRGERVLLYSGEFHPFRLPVPDLWLDVFQKIKALGYSGVSFYVDWALVEPEQGNFRADGVFALEPFFDAAVEAGIYLIARPGPYINAEVSGGGFPGWLIRVNGTYRSNSTDFLQATDLYAREVGSIIAKAQITNGGPVILFQPENEYTIAGSDNIGFPSGDYFQYVIEQFRNAGIVVPMISNDAFPLYTFAPGSTTADADVQIDIFGHDAYPVLFNCQNPDSWLSIAPVVGLQTNWGTLHDQSSPTTPYSIIEFQGGAFDPWGGYGFDNCAALTNEGFERIFHKNNWSFKITIFNIYMTYGGTNWGNLGHHLGYTSYDYGAPIMEDRGVTRAKYSEAKLLANFLKVTPSYFTATNLNLTNATYTSTPELGVTPIIGNGSDTDLYIVRHYDYSSHASTAYTLTVPSSAGNITIPQLNRLSDHLTLNGRDSKAHVVDYDLAGINLLYSSAEIFTWQKYDANTVLVLYGGENETHEFAVPSSQCSVALGDPSFVAINTLGSQDVVQWAVTPEAKVVQCGSLTVHLLWRNDAYNWWVLELPAEEPVLNYTSSTKSSVVIKGGYLMRSASMEDGNLYLTGDINATTPITVAGSPSFANLYFNGKNVGKSPATVEYAEPSLNLPDLSQVAWSSLDSLPEVSPSYSDILWTNTDRTETVNQFQPTTPEVLYASDYGYHAGSLLYRGHFTTPTGVTSLNLSISTQGGFAYGYSLWLNSTNIFEYPGYSTSQSHNLTLQLTSLAPSTDYVLTLLVDHMGLTGNYYPGNDTLRDPRGLTSYALSASSQSIPVTWKLTGNLGGERYVDKTRGPLNEGAMFFERQGFHLPGAPTHDKSVFTSSDDSPLTGFSGPGVRFYATTFGLSLPAPEYDVPLAFVFTNSTAGDRPSRFRSQLYVNGWQFGKYVNHIGPQTSYPVPEGVLNYNGDNYIGLSLWNMEDGKNTTVKLDGFQLTTSNTPVMSGRGREVKLSYTLPQDGWSHREGVY